MIDSVDIFSHDVIVLFLLLISENQQIKRRQKFTYSSVTAAKIYFPGKKRS